MNSRATTKKTIKGGKNLLDERKNNYKMLKIREDRGDKVNIELEFYQ